MSVLFLNPNFLILDEPTNDLDINTLELLEDLLQNYEGTVFLVSHDRTFLDNVVTSTLAFEGDGLWREYEGGVQDWLIQSKRSKELRSATQLIASRAQTMRPESQKSIKFPANQGAATSGKLNNRDQRELDGLPNLIAALETEQAALRQKLNDDGLYASDPTKAGEMYQRDAALDDELLRHISRWEELSSR